MKIKFLRKIAQVIQEKPAKFDMRYLHLDREGYATSRECGTAHCLAGWAGVLLNKDFGAPEFGQYLGIDTAATYRLCFAGQWPEPFRSRYQSAKQRRTRAKIAAARIEHFIATGGAE